MDVEPNRPNQTQPCLGCLGGIVWDLASLFLRGLVLGRP